MAAAVIESPKEDDVPAEFNPWTTSIIAYFCLATVCALALHPTAFSMVKTWASSSGYVHGFVIAPISLWMIAAKSPSRLSNASILPGLFIMIAGAVLWLIGRAGSALIIEQIAFVSLLIGAVGVVFGAQTLRDWAFPLAFLYFMVPFGEILVPSLQILTASFLISLLTIFGADVSLDGYIITTPTGAFEVAEACAGLNFLIAALMIAAAFAYLHFQGWRKRIAFLAFAATIAVLANGLRAFLIIAIATLTKNQWSIGPDHILLGWLFYAAVLFLLISVGLKHADALSYSETEPSRPIPPYYIFARVTAGLVIIANTIAYGQLVVERPVTAVAPSSLTLLNAPGWRILPPPSNWRATLPNADRTLAATYTSTNATVYVSVGYFTHERKDAEIVTYANRAWDGNYWRRSGATRDVVYLFGKSKKTGITKLIGPNRSRLAVVSAYWLGDEVYLEPWRMKFAQMKARLRGANPPGGVVMIAAPYRLDSDEALQAIRAFTVNVEQLQQWLDRNPVS